DPLQPVPRFLECGSLQGVVGPRRRAGLLRGQGGAACRLRPCGRHPRTRGLCRRQEPPDDAAARRNHGQRPVRLSRLRRPVPRGPLGEGHARLQPRAVHQVSRQAARVRRAQRFDLPSVRRGQPPPHGVPARPRPLRRRAGRGDPAGVPRDLSEVLPPRPRRSEGNVRADLMRALLEESFRAAVAAADPLRILAPHLPPPPQGRTFVAAAGKALSAIQGGRLAAACRAPVLALIISDVTGDDPTHIASGPCAPDPTTCDDARSVLAKYRIAFPGRLSETPKPGDPVFRRVENRVIATAHRSLEAAAEVFAKRNIQPVILGDTITGEAAEVAKVMAGLVREIRKYSTPFRPPVALISGGECTVTVREDGGRGGRSAEFLLSLAIELQGLDEVWAMAADTDGIDGSEDNAGAF